MLDDASIGLSMMDAGAVIAYVPAARIEIGAARSLRQWYRQKLRLRRGWKLLKRVHPERVGLLQATLSANTLDLCRGNPAARLLRLLDRAMALFAEMSRVSAAEKVGLWKPDRAGWNVAPRDADRSPSQKPDHFFATSRRSVR